jgi:hypothetical protein
VHSYHDNFAKRYQSRTKKHLNFQTISIFNIFSFFFANINFVVAIVVAVLPSKNIIPILDQDELNNRQPLKQADSFLNRSTVLKRVDSTGK